MLIKFTVICNRGYLKLIIIVILFLYLGEAEGVFLDFKCNISYCRILIACIKK